ncbi:MAG: hypothetical protein QOD55_298 [Solirubrobacteraceae bacterium]|nr:hypothetical protein [Solirubrobacteraceae bacterium]
MLGWLGAAGFVASITRLAVDVWRHERKKVKKRARKAAKEARRVARNAGAIKQPVH